MNYVTPKLYAAHLMTLMDVVIAGITVKLLRYLSVISMPCFRSSVTIYRVVPAVNYLVKLFGNMVSSAGMFKQSIGARKRSAVQACQAT
jgi:hypothetical protein